MSFTENVKNSFSWVTLKWHLSIGDFVVYIDTGGPVPNIPSKSRGLADEKKSFWRNGNDSKQPYCFEINYQNEIWFRPMYYQ
jgi:hypothetical protein